MKHIHKKAIAFILAMVMLFSFTGMAYAVEVPSEPTQQMEDRAGDAITIFEYTNDSFNKSAVERFTVSKGGKATLILGASTLSGVSDGTITMRLYVENALGQYALVDSISTNTDGSAKKLDTNFTLYKGDKCMLTIEAASNKDMIVVGQVIVRY